MTKRPFVYFGILVAIAVVVIPVFVFAGNGESTAGGREVPKDLETGKMLFQTNCGTCHTLYVAGTDGNFGPNLDLLLAPTGPPSGDTAESTIKSTASRVLNAVDNGVDTTTTTGRMPQGILSGQQADEVADFVANVAGRG